MALNINETFIGAPVQEVSGAVHTAAVGTTAPTDATSTLGSSWTDSGYVDENGVSFSQDRSTTNIKDWSGATIRTLLDEFNGTVQYTEAQTNYETMCRMVGASNVTKTDATTGHGTQLKVQIGAEMPPALAWCFDMADKRSDTVTGRLRLYIPSGQVTSVDSVSFVSDDIVKWSFTITANKTEGEEPIVLFTDDGVKASQ